MLMTDQVAISIGCNTYGVLGWPYLENLKQKLKKLGSVAVNVHMAASLCHVYFFKGLVFMT